MKRYTSSKSATSSDAKSARVSVWRYIRKKRVCVRERRRGGGGGGGVESRERGRLDRERHTLSYYLIELNFN